MHRNHEELRRMVVSEKMTVQQAVQRMDEKRLGLVLVLDEDARLAGLVTNGDFRRFVLAGRKLGEPVTEAMNRSPVVVRTEPAEELDEALRQSFEKDGIAYVPVIDKSGHVVDVVYPEDLGHETENGSYRDLPTDCPVVVMAGGMGTRLDPFTRILPKPLIPIGDKSIIEIIMDRFAAQGVERFWLSINHKGRMIRAYFEELDASYRVSYLEEEQPLGTAGALKQLSGRFDSPVFVTNCDILVTADLASIYDFHLRERADLTVVGSAQQHTIPYGVCDLNTAGNLKKIVEKPSYDVVVNTGMYVLSPSAFDRIPAGRKVDMTELIEGLLAAGSKVSVYPVPESAWLDVGQWEEYRKTVARLGRLGG